MIAVWDELVTLNYDACRCLQSADWSTVVGQGSVLFEDSIRLARRSNISQLAWCARQRKTAMKMVNLFVASPYVEITLGCITAKTSLQGALWPSSRIFWLKCYLRCLKTIVCDCYLRWTCNIKLWCMQMSAERRLKYSSCSRLGPLWRQFQACEQI